MNTDALPGAKCPVAHDSDAKSIHDFLILCGWPSTAATILVAYWTEAAPAKLTENPFHRWLPHTDDTDFSHFLKFLDEAGALDILDSGGFEAVIREQKGTWRLPLSLSQSTFEEALAAVKPAVARKLETIQERNRRALLIRPVLASSPEAKAALLKAVRESDHTIKLTANSLLSFFKKWKLDEICLEKLLAGVNVQILLVAPEARTELHRESSIQETRQLLDEFAQMARGPGKLEVRLCRDERFGFFSGLLTYGKPDKRSGAPTRLTARFNLRFPERGTLGFIFEALGDTSLFRVLEAYFDHAWRRAQPLYGSNLLRRALWKVQSKPVAIALAVGLAAFTYLAPKGSAPLVFLFLFWLALAPRHDDYHGHR